MITIEEYEKFFRENNLDLNILKRIKDKVKNLSKYYKKLSNDNILQRYYQAIYKILSKPNNETLDENIPIIKEIDLYLSDIIKDLNYAKEKRLGVFGWGLVGPQSPNVETFFKKLYDKNTWLEPFDHDGPTNFMIGKPDFDQEEYEKWVLEKHGKSRLTLLEKKMGNNVKFAISSFIQALKYNPKLEEVLPELGADCHIYVGVGVGDVKMQYESSLQYLYALKEWYRFWGSTENCKLLREYENLQNEDEKQNYLRKHEAPEDPKDKTFSTLREKEEYYDSWFAFWSSKSENLAQYLKEAAEINKVDIWGDVEKTKVNVIKKKLVSFKKLWKKWKCPEEPWTAVSQNRIWNIDNIPAAQISMLSKIMGLAISPVGACSTFVVALEMARNAIMNNRAKVCVVGAVDPSPHGIQVSSFNNARLVSNDGEVSAPFMGLRGTHISGGGVVWIIGDIDYMLNKGLKPIGAEIMGLGLSSDADHIITPSPDGPKIAIERAIEDANIKKDDISMWSCHATATPGDINEVKLIQESLDKQVLLEARKGQFGHGMSAVGGWELTALLKELEQGTVFPTDLKKEKLNQEVTKINPNIIVDEAIPVPGKIAGKINMGVGGINGCAIIKQYDSYITLEQFSNVTNLTADEIDEKINSGEIKVENMNGDFPKIHIDYLKKY